MTTTIDTDLILGTAGHIDHGKSSLVAALTGTDPDRLAEEKQRGITIELGFARLALADGTTLGVVDVPGHERFVRQMIAGSTGIDIALLCIAADDGVMPQTVEHLAVLELLGIPSCVVALTKADMVDDEWLLFMSDEVRAHLAKTTYAQAPIVAVSSRTGQGLDTLKAALGQTAAHTSRAKTGAALRLPVDRVFTIKGAGTVVTGTLWSGQAKPDDEVESLPQGIHARIRGVQVHGKQVEQAQAGQRVALNLNALSTSDIRPGDFLITPNSSSTTDHFDADISYLGSPGHIKPLESGTRVHVAHGTREVLGRVLFLDNKPSLAPGEHGLAQIRLDEPLPVLWRDRFVIRSYSPVHVIGGGSVLRAHPRRTTTLSAGNRTLLNALKTEDEAAIAAAAFALTPYPVTPIELATSSGLNEHTASEQLENLVKKKAAVRLAANQGVVFYTSKPILQKHLSTLENVLLKFHAEQPTAPGIAKTTLHQRCLPRASEACFDALLGYAVEQGSASITAGLISHPKAGAGARQIEQQAAEQLQKTLTLSAKTPPNLTDLISQSGLDSTLAHRALGFLEKQGMVRKIGRDFYFESTALTSLESAVRDRLAAGPATAADLKEAMGTSRKYAIPLLEYFDAQGITRREGDTRILNR